MPKDSVSIPTGFSFERKVVISVMVYFKVKFMVIRIQGDSKVACRKC